jgi:hypothetical protein
MDVVTYGADATQFFDVHAQMQRAARSTSATLGDTSGLDGFLRGEYRVERQSHLLAASLFGARDAASGVAAALQAFALSTNIGLVATVGALAIAEGIRKISEQSEKTKKAFEELEAELAKPLGVQTHLSSEAIGSDLDKLAQKVKALRKELNSGTTALKDFLFGGAGGGFPATAAGLKGGVIPKGALAPGAVSPEEKALIEAETRLRDLADAQADAELRVVAIKRQRLTVSELSAEISKAQLDFENKTAAFLETAFKPGVDQLSIFKRFAAAQQDRDLDIKAAKQKASLENESLTHARELADIESRGLSKRDETIAKLTSELAYRLRILKAAQQLGDIKGIAAANVGVAQAEAGVANARQQFFRDVATGKVIADIMADKLAKEQEAEGERLIAELRADRARGVALGPVAQAELDKADILDKAKATGLKALAGQDFSGLASLGNLPFSGLKSLDGLTITIK